MIINSIIDFYGIQLTIIKFIFSLKNLLVIIKLPFKGNLILMFYCYKQGFHKINNVLLLLAHKLYDHMLDNYLLNHELDLSNYIYDVLKMLYCFLDSRFFTI